MDSLNNATKLGGDAWLELQAFKTRQINRREKLNRHKDLLNAIVVKQDHNVSSSSFTNDLSPIELIQTDLNLTSDKKNTTNNLVPHASTNKLAEQNHSIPEPPSRSENMCLQSQFSDGDKTPSNILDSPHNQPNTRISRIEAVPGRRVNLDTVECLLLLKLCDVALKLPIDSKSLQRSICKVRGLDNTPLSTIEDLLEKFAHQELITIDESSTSILKRLKKRAGHDDESCEDETCIYVNSADHSKLVEFDKTFGSSENIRALLAESRSDDANIDDVDVMLTQNTRAAETRDHSKYLQDSREVSLYAQREIQDKVKQDHPSTSSHDYFRRQLHGDDVESLLSLSSTRERENKRLGEELLELLSKPTAKEKSLLERFRSADGYQVQEFCPKGTKDECRRYNKGTQACDKLHFKKIIAKHTEESLGDCSFLNTCFHMDSCKYVHYEVDYDKEKIRIDISKVSLNSLVNKKSPANQTRSRRSIRRARREALRQMRSISEAEKKAADEQKQIMNERARMELNTKRRFKTVLHPPQWIQCDLRYFDMSLLGKFSVVMADPPWDIHMELPYGTMSDDEMRKLNVPALQDDGVIFLWVTGRAMELGRECLALWGYERCDEIIWVKTNQLQRIIRTGRTGHWLNHGKEHCLVGIKGNPTNINRGLDCDIIVAEVRATSHKPDEIYGIIERLSPGTRKIELFGRAHNVQPNWITLGNQLNGVRLVEPNLIEAFKKSNLPYETSDSIG